MRVRASSFVVVALLTLSVLTAPAASAAPPSSAPPLPDSMAAIGDSFTYGFATGAVNCGYFQSCPASSWATGTAVNSHYARVLAQNPAISGQVHNVASPGSTMAASFLGQANSAAASHPDYVTVVLGAGDVCLNATMTSVADFTARFRAGMVALTSASPDSKVLVASVWNLESMRQAVLSRNPVPTWPLCGAFFDAGDSVRATMMARAVEFNDVMATECATFANCRFDGNALFDHVWVSDEVSTADNLHPSVAGQEMLSEVLWNAGFWGAATSHPSCRAKDAAHKGAEASNRAVPVPCR